MTKKQATIQYVTANQLALYGFSVPTQIAE